MKLKSFRIKDTRATLYFEGESHNISNILFDTLGITRGSEVDEDTMSRIIEDEREYLAMKKALSLLAFADNSPRALRDKLIRSGFSREMSESVVAECISRGYINEQRQIERLALTEANSSLRGKRYIVAKLARRGYSASLVSRVIDSLVESGDIDFHKNLTALTKKLGITSPEEKRKIAYKYGFTID